jgi:hypothetical protein
VGSGVGSSPGVSVSAGVSAFSGVSVILAVVPVEPVLVWALTTPFATVAPVVVSSGSDFSVDVWVDVCVGVPVVVSVVVVLEFVDVSVDAVSAEVVFEDVESGVSAEATPYPLAIAVPTPNATASPPTRPI